MKKVNPKEKDELRPEYQLSDFPKGMVRGKYSKRISESSNIVVLQPDAAVNTALLSLIEIAQKTARKPKRSTPKKKVA